MPDQALAVEGQSLSQVGRVVDTYVAPSKTFTDILRNASWWLPCILLLIFSAAFSYTAIHQVGIARMSENLLATMPKMQDMISNSKPEQAQQIHDRFQKNISSQFYSGPLILIASSFLISLLFMGSANFAFGGKATYKRMLAMFWYSLLPLVISSILISLLLWLGVNTETFRVSNPIGTNPGYYLPDGSSPLLVALLSFIDVFSIWVFCLQTIGTAKVAGLSLGKAAGAVAIWWVLFMLLKLVPVLLFS